MTSQKLLDEIEKLKNTPGLSLDQQINLIQAEVTLLLASEIQGVKMPIGGASSNLGSHLGMLTKVLEKISLGLGES